MEAFVLLGSNLGNRVAALSTAIELLTEALGTPVRYSQVYASESWGFSGQDFLNQLLVFSTTEPPLALIQILLETEKKMGRQRNHDEGYSDRIIDIDLLYLGNIHLESVELTLPHPRLHLRRFTLVPLVELAPHMIHPQTGKSHLQLLSGLQDNNRVWLHTNDYNVFSL